MYFDTPRLDNLDLLMDEVIQKGEPLAYKISAHTIKELIADIRELQNDSAVLDEILEQNKTNY